MNRVAGVSDLAEQVAAAATVVPVGGRTHWEVGGPAPAGEEVRAPAGILEYDPAELTVTLGAGTTVAELAATLDVARQQCALDPRSSEATVGGVLATGLSGRRRLRYGPVRDRVLEVHVVLASGRVVKAGGRTVKNVTGYDIPRLVVGSLGTLGVIAQVTLRCDPQPHVATWFGTPLAPVEVRRRVLRPGAVLTSSAWEATRVLLEGHAADVDAARDSLGTLTGFAEPGWPAGAHRGRISVRPSALPTVVASLSRLPVEWQAEWGIGTVHVAAREEAPLAEARAAATAAGGWMLREAGAPGIDGFGTAIPNPAIAARLRCALDPTGKCNPGRLP